MTITTTFQPTATNVQGSGVTITGESTVHAALGLGDSDYVTIPAGAIVAGSYVSVEFAVPTLTYAGLVSIEVGLTARQNGSDLGGNRVRFRLAALRSNGKTTTLATRTENSVGTSFTTTYGDPINVGPFTDIVRLYGSVEGDFTYDMDVSEFFVNLNLANLDSDVVNVETLTPDPWTDSTTPRLNWYNDFEDALQNSVQSHYQIRAFDEATYGATFSGLDPDSDTPYWDSGELVGDITTADIGPLETADGYRVYVRVAQIVNGRQVWTPWVDNANQNFDTFDVDVDTSDVDTVTAAATNASGLITVTVARDTGSEAWEFIEVQRSVEGSGVWEYVRGAQLVEASGNSFEVIDYEAVNGTSYDYRARATYYDTGLPITGSWVETTTAEDWTSTDFWLKNPLDPTDNTTFCLGSRQNPFNRSRRTGVFDVVDAKFPITRSGTRSGRTGVLTIYTETAAEAAAVDDLLDNASTILVQYPAGLDTPDAYIAILSDADVFEHNVADDDHVHRMWTIEYVEVAAPADTTAGSF